MEKNKKRILKIDPYLMPYEKDIEQRVKLYKENKKQLLKNWLPCFFMKKPKKAEKKSYFLSFSLCNIKI